MSVYSRRSSSSSSGRSNGSTISVKSTDLNVPRSKSLSVVTYLAGGDPRRHKNLRRQKITTEYDNGTYDVREQLFWVRDPYEATYYWASSGYDDYDDRSSVYSGGSSRASSRRSGGKHGGHRSRGGAPAAVPVQPMPPPPQQGQHMPMGMCGGMPMGVPMGMPMGGGGMPPQMGGMPPMMGGGGQGPMMGDEMVEDDDYSSVCSTESYSSSGSGSYGSPHPGAMPPHMMSGGGMPGMVPPAHMGGMGGPPMQMPMPHMGGQPPMTSSHPPEPSVHHGVDNGGGDDIPEFFQIS